jgi:hypothetical protein
MNRLSFRMILSIVVLSALHMAAIADNPRASAHATQGVSAGPDRMLAGQPLAVRATRLPQGATSQPPVRAPVTLSSRQPI